MLLAQRFVEDYADGGGQVETADFAGWHGDHQSPVAMALEQFDRQTVRLAAKKKAISRLIGNQRVGDGRMGAEAKDAGARQGHLDVFHDGVASVVDVGPVLEAGAPE